MYVNKDPKQTVQELEHPDSGWGLFQTSGDGPLTRLLSAIQGPLRALAGSKIQVLIYDNVYHNRLGVDSEPLSRTAPTCKSRQQHPQWSPNGGAAQSLQYSLEKLIPTWPYSPEQHLANGSFPQRCVTGGEKRGDTICRRYDARVLWNAGVDSHQLEAHRACLPVESWQLATSNAAIHHGSYQLHSRPRLNVSEIEPCRNQ